MLRRRPAVGLYTIARMGRELRGVTSSPDRHQGQRIADDGRSTFDEAKRRGVGHAGRGLMLRRAGSAGGGAFQQLAMAEQH
jgi:hypothetical protein